MHTYYVFVPTTCLLLYKHCSWIISENEHKKLYILKRILFRACLGFVLVVPYKILSREKYTRAELCKHAIICYFLFCYLLCTILVQRQDSMFTACLSVGLSPMQQGHDHSQHRCMFSQFNTLTQRIVWTQRPAGPRYKPDPWSDPS